MPEPRPTRTTEGTVVVITGASSGVGRATALAFARRGAAVAVAARAHNQLRAVTDDGERLGGTMVAVPTDVSDARAVRELSRTTVESFGRIDVWVNNAAVVALGAFLEIPEDAFRSVVETNFLGYVNGARAALEQFLRQRGGVLVNVSSLFGKMGAPNMSPYVASKFAVEGLSESLRQEFASEPHIHICNVLPGGIDTPLYDHGANYSGRAVNPLYPVLDPDTVADAIVACASRPRREVRVGRISRAQAVGRSLAPSLYERLGGRFGPHMEFLDRPGAVTDGNLFQSRPPYGVWGGWRSRRARPIRRLARGLIAGFGGP